MSDPPNSKPKPLMTFVFDEVRVFTCKAEPNPLAELKLPVANAASTLTVEADEMTEFVMKAIPAKHVTIKTEAGAS